ncbi:MAG: RnfABCDGE type electron transport complex subunit D [Thiobacillus sp.]|nr:RnfABCDGE type electron transport complex subunit D [Thiobacillus sp.]
MTTIAHSPHARAANSVSRIMATVMLALVPVTLFGFWLNGWPAVYLWTVSLAAALVGEAAALKFQRRAVKPALLDGSGVLTAWLLALSLPPWAPWWIAVVGSLFAVVIAKQVFGGLGQNVFNPAMAARVMLLISFPLEMTIWVPPMSQPGLLDSLAVTFGGGQLDAVSSASLLGHVKTEFSRGLGLEQALAGHYAPLEALWGRRSGSLGETSALLIFIGGVFLLARRTITWHAPVAMLAGVALPALLMNLVAPEHYADPVYHLLSGGVMLAAFFIVTDPVTSPNTALGQLLFGLGCGLLTYVIRTWGSYPEGVAFAVMLMNAATPLIDRNIKPRIYGRTRQGAPLMTRHAKKDAA